MAAAGATAPAQPADAAVAAPAAPPTLSPVEAAFRMSADGRHMNLAQLRSRATLLHAKLDEFHRRLAATVPGTAAWSETLSMFAVLNAQLGALSGELRPLLGHYVVHPEAASLSSAAPWFREHALPAMHSARLEPAMEAEEAGLLARQRGGAPAASPAFALDHLQQGVDAHNARLAACLEVLQRGRVDVARGVEAAKGGEGGAAARGSPPAHAVARLLGASQFGEGIRAAGR